MAALVQPYLQQSGSGTMLQGRATATSNTMAAGQPSVNHQYMGSTAQAPRSGFHGVGPINNFRGNNPSIQPYTFNTTSNLNQGTLLQQQYGAFRTNSSPAVPSAQMVDPNMLRAHRSNVSVTNMALLPSFNGGQGVSRDDSAIGQSRAVVQSSRPQTHKSTVSQASLSLGGGISSKNAPDRYRRSTTQPSQHSRNQSSVSMTPGGNQIYHAPNGSRSVPNLSVSHATNVGPAVEDAQTYRRQSTDEISRLRRRSVHNMESGDPRLALRAGDVPRAEHVPSSKSSRSSDRSEKSPRIVPVPKPAHHRNGSSDSVSSSRSGHSRTPSSTNRNVPVPTASPSPSASDETSTKNDQLKVVNVPPRGSSSDGGRRTISPSPLSKPATMATEPGETSNTVTNGTPSNRMDSPAAKQLAAISQKGERAKSKTSRLRRAFSFGSAAEFRKAAGTDDDTADKAEPAKLHKDPTPGEAYDAEQARIVQAQEAGGIGSSIYGGRFFGSTDNLSISSTASSASIMIRKMGRGMKNRTRSLVGLFRPKSVIGVPAADSAVPDESQAAVSMITVEAETQRVNVSASPQAGHGGTGFPRLERNSLDVAQVPELAPERAGSSGTDNSTPRKSIVGGDKERAEVLAAVRKGILKRASSPSLRTGESPDLVLPSVPAITDSPNSSAPSTPNDDAQGHRRNGSIAIGNEDYFMSALRLRQDSKSRPETPQALAKRNATFSPRIVFHDTWPSQEYDRRGDIATCNRLTPMLAQQIKEELNSFKMEMEVHENSKIYTHFF